MGKKTKAPKAGAAARSPAETLLALYRLLREIEPTEERLDLIWNGPFWVNGKRAWHSTTFLLRRGILHGQIHLPRGGPLMEGNIETGEIVFPQIDLPGWPPGEDYWPQALPQLHETLRAALTDLEAYNRQVDEDVPRGSRTGKITRHLTWGQDVERMPEERSAAVRRAAESAGRRPHLPAMSTAEYQRVAAVAYDAAYPTEQGLTAAEKQRRHADGRHGGMLDLPPDDAAAFAEWFDSHRWQGAHPFEIVYGHPHGIMLWLEHDRKKGWRFKLHASDEFYYDDVLKMVVALDQAGIPFEFHQTESLLARFEGTDDVEVGPHRDELPLAELRKVRPDSVAKIRWDPLPKLLPVTAEGKARIAWVEEHGTMMGFDEDE